MSIKLSAFSVALLFTVAACSPTSQAVYRRAIDTTLPSGWRVDCNYDQFKAENRCFAATFSDDAPFQVVYINDSGPTLFTPHNYPGRRGTVRVDDGPVRFFEDATNIVNDMKVGQKAFVVYHVWPEGERNMIVDITGFSQAFALLQQKRSDTAQRR